MSKKHIHKFRVKVLAKAKVIEVRKKPVELFSLERQYCKCGVSRMVSRDIENTPRLVIGYVDGGF